MQAGCPSVGGLPPSTITCPPRRAAREEPVPAVGEGALCQAGRQDQNTDAMRVLHFRATRVCRALACLACLACLADLTTAQSTSTGACAAELAQSADAISAVCCAGSVCTEETAIPGSCSSPCAQLLGPLVRRCGDFLAENMPALTPLSRLCARRRLQWGGGCPMESLQARTARVMDACCPPPLPLQPGEEPTPTTCDMPASCGAPSCAHEFLQFFEECVDTVTSAQPQCECAHKSDLDSDSDST